MNQGHKASHTQQQNELRMTSIVLLAVVYGASWMVGKALAIATIEVIDWRNNRKRNQEETNKREYR